MPIFLAADRITLYHDNMELHRTEVATLGREMLVLFVIVGFSNHLSL